MFTRFDASKSTKGASKLRRDLINAEIANLRDLLPLPPSTRQRLSQLQLMALVCVYVRKANYFQQVFKRHDSGLHYVPTPNIGFSKALSGFLMMMTQNGKLLYISDNAAEYLGHSMEDLLIHGDSVYDIIDKQDHQAIQAELVRTSTNPGDEDRMFLCRMNVSRNARRQMRFGDQKVVLVQGHYLSYLPLCSRNEPVFLATCTPVAMPETRECVVQGATNVFTSIHSMDMKFVHIDKNGEFHLGFPRSELHGASWYQLLHWDCMREAQSKHRLITQSEQDRSCILLLRMQRRAGDWLWVHCVLQVKDNMENSQQPVIVCTNQVLSEREAGVMRANSWLYHYYMAQSKLQYGLAYEAHAASRMAAAAAAYYHPHPHQHPATGGGVAASHPGVATYQHVDASHHHAYLQHQVSPGGVGHHHSLNGNHQVHHGGETTASPTYQPTPVAVDAVAAAAAAFRFRRHEPEPVDYSVHSNQDEMDERYVEMHHMPVEEARTPSLKRKAGMKMELPKTPMGGSPRSSPSSEDIMELRGGTPGGGGLLLATTPMSTSLHHSLGRPRLLVKSATMMVDPAEFMDQWNPSPPWSDTTLQKVPDMIQQELSPYMTTTPPTPTGTPSSLGGGSHSHQPPHTAFTFDWMPEQYVPNLQGARSMHAMDDDQYHVLATAAAWPSEHRLFPLQPPPAPRMPTGMPTMHRIDVVDGQHSPAKDSRD